MKKIEVKILNPESIDQAEKLMVCAARLTQRGHQISCLDDFMDLYEKTISEIHRGKSCETATSDNSEVWNYQCGCSRCIQKIPGTDYPAPK